MEKRSLATHATDAILLAGTTGNFQFGALLSAYIQGEGPRKINSYSLTFIEEFF